MEKEKVEVFVKDLMEKLQMKNRELDDIMRCYSAEGHAIPFFKNEVSILKQNDVGNKGSDDEILESARKVYFPWIDVIGSMMEHPEEVRYVENVCPDCGEKLLLLEFWSPHWTWRALCGRSGPMLICPNCSRQDSFSLHLMN